jgi:hypothetical protein
MKICSTAVAPIPASPIQAALMPWALDSSADWIASFESWEWGTTMCLIFAHMPDPWSWPPWS